MLEVGKTYKTRAGRSVRVLATDATTISPVVAVVKHADGVESVRTYQANGRYVLSREHPLDIMIEEEYLKVADIERMFDEYFNREWRGRECLLDLFNGLPRYKF